MSNAEYKRIETSELRFNDEYYVLYKKAYENKKNKVSPIKSFIRKILTQVRDEESSYIFSIESQKIEEIISSESNDYSSLSEVTRNIIISDNGFSLSNIKRFYEELKENIESDILVHYDDLERNIEMVLDKSDGTKRA